jgi:RNA polymerase sigma-70 factor (ECF subfamily)
MIEDKKIIEGCLKHDRIAQQWLFEKYSRQMLAWCMRYAESRVEAEDILQDALVRVYFNIDDYTGKGSFAGWLRKIAVNSAITHYHKNLKYRRQVDIDDYIVAESSMDDNDCQFTSEELMGVLNELPPGFRMIFNLYAIEGYKHKEIAKQLNIDQGTSKSQYSRAKVLIRAKLDKLAMEKCKRPLENE